MSYPQAWTPTVALHVIIQTSLELDLKYGILNERKCGISAWERLISPKEAPFFFLREFREEDAGTGIHFSLADDLM